MMTWLKSRLSGIFTADSGIWAVKDYADGWILFKDKAKALEYSKKTGAAMVRHVHDYDMVFAGPDTLDYQLICKCGDVAPSMEEALRRRGWLGMWL